MEEETWEREGGGIWGRGGGDFDGFVHEVILAVVGVARVGRNGFQVEHSGGGRVVGGG